MTRIKESEMLIFIKEMLYGISKEDFVEVFNRWGGGNFTVEDVEWDIGYSFSRLSKGDKNEPVVNG